MLFRESPYKSPLMRKYILSFLLSLLCSGLCAQVELKEPVDYVDPLMGTTIPQWTLFPGATTPSGMVKISPDNQVNGWEAGYDYKIESIAGFSHIHSRTMGGLLVMPVTGELKTTPGKPTEPGSGYRSRFSHSNETALLVITRSFSMIMVSGQSLPQRQGQHSRDIHFLKLIQPES